MSGADSREHTGGELIAERYQLGSRLGRGATGEVWSGRDLRLHRDVAVKLFHGGAGMSAADLPGWLRREGIAAAQIVHPNVAVLYDQGAHRGRIYLIMELVPGTTLAELMQAGRLPVASALSHAAQIAEALAAAHAARVVHRDIKPQNVLVTPEGTVKVVDFGIAGFLADTRSWTIARFDDAVKGAGTPEYSAPEQILGHNADARSDLYSLGTLLYAMLAGQLPYRAADFLAVMRRKTTEDAPPVPAGAGVPRDVITLVAELLARDPEQRPGSAREVATRLRALLERKPAEPTSKAEEPAGNAGERSIEVETTPASAEPWTAPPLEAEVGTAQPKPAAKLKAQAAPNAAAAGTADEDEPSERTERSAAKSPEVKSPAAPKPFPWGPQAANVRPAEQAPADPEPADRQVPDPEVASQPDSQAGSTEPKPRPADPQPADHEAAKGQSADRQAAARPPADRPAFTPAPDPASKQPPNRARKSAAKTPTAKPKSPPAWGASKDHVTPPETSAWEPLAATGATVLSAVAEVEIRGRSLLPPPARSLLAGAGAGPSGERYTPSSPSPTPEPPEAPESPRRGLLPIVLIVLAVAAVAVAAIVLTSR